MVVCVECGEAIVFGGHKIRGRGYVCESCFSRIGCETKFTSSNGDSYKHTDVRADHIGGCPVERARNQYQMMNFLAAMRGFQNPYGGMPLMNPYGGMPLMNPMTFVDSQPLFTSPIFSFKTDDDDSGSSNSSRKKNKTKTVAFW